jgi:hypothetical protein
VYEKITKGMTEAQEAAQKALEDADVAERMVEK